MSPAYLCPTFVVKGVQSLLQLREPLIKRELLLLKALYYMCQILVLRLLLLYLWTLITVTKCHISLGLLHRQLQWWDLPISGCCCC